MQFPQLEDWWAFLMEVKINLKPYAPKHLYARNGKKCFLDPFRQMLVPYTKESLMLYKMEMYVHQVMGVPKSMMYVNQSFRKYGIDASKVIDIVIHDMIDGEMKPVAIVECKSPGLALYHTTTAHIEDFAKKIGVNYLIVTNGNDVDSYISREDRLSFWKIDNIPDYETICNGHRAVLATTYALHPELQHKKPAPKPVPAPKFNASKTPKELQPIIMDLSKCFKDDRSKLVPQTIEELALVGDCGIRKKLHGFGSEKMYNPLTRVILIKDFYGNHQLMSLELSPDEQGAALLSVGLDDYENRQLIYSINLADCCIKEEQGVRLECKLTKLLSKETPEFVDSFERYLHDKAPQLLHKHELNFGKLGMLDTLKMDQDDVAAVITRLFALALVLDEYREHIKSNQRKKKKVEKA